MLRRPSEIDTKEFIAFKKKAIKFKFQGNHLFCRNSKNVPMWCVLDDPVERQTILQQLRNESGHRMRKHLLTSCRRILVG